MAARTTFARITHYLRKFNKSNVIFLQKLVRQIGHRLSALTTRPGVLKLLLLAYPKIDIESLCIHLNQIWSPLRTPKSTIVSLVWTYFDMI